MSESDVCAKMRGVVGDITGTYKHGTARLITHLDFA